MKALSLSKIGHAVLYAETVIFLSMVACRQVLAIEFGGPMPDINVASAGSVGDTRSALEKTINIVLGFLALIAVIFVIVGGFRIMMAGGNEENVTKGRKTIVYAIIGLVIIFFSRVIVAFITREVADPFG